jgi:hypothetical protein
MEKAQIQWRRRKKMIRVVSIMFLLFAISNVGQAQAPTIQGTASPEEGFVSQTKYTNAFFGFALAIPQNAQMHILALPSTSPSAQFLFGLESQDHGLTTVIVDAKQTPAASSDDAREAASGSKDETVKPIEIGGKEFWKSEAQNKSSAGKMRTVKYATALDGYVLEFDILSFNNKLAEELEQNIESVTFFDPAKAKQMAGEDSQPYNPAGPAVPKPSGLLKELSSGAVSGNSYTNSALGFSCQFPMGWYQADETTQRKVIGAGHQAAWGNSPSAAQEHEAAQNCTKVLLWVNREPEGSKTADLNPLIMILAADPQCVPGVTFPTSSDDHEGVRNIVQAVVRSLAGSLVMSGAMKVGTFSLQGHLFLNVSGVSQANVPGHALPVELHNSLVFTSLKGFWTIWVFSSGSEAELQELKHTNITFLHSNTVP